MHDRSDSTDKNNQLEKSTAMDYISRLTEEEKMLILLQKELYDGSWDSMMADLQNRLDGKPYIFKLANRIKDDISRIEKLMEFERHNNIRLSEYIQPPS